MPAGCCQIGLETRGGGAGGWREVRQVMGARSVHVAAGDRRRWGVGGGVGLGREVRRVGRFGGIRQMEGAGGYKHLCR